MERGKYRGPKENSPSSSGHARAGRSRPRSGGGQLAGRPAARGGARPHLLGAEEGPHGAGSLARTRPAATRAAARFGAQEPAGRTAQGGSVMGPGRSGSVATAQREHARSPSGAVAAAPCLAARECRTRSCRVLGSWPERAATARTDEQVAAARGWSLG
jgi:hypothetical protein